MRRCSFSKRQGDIENIDVANCSDNDQIRGDK